MSARLVLIRHGESVWNAERRLQGQADPPLSDAGRAEARALAPLLEHLPRDGVVASDLLRARETAELAGLGRPETDPAWRETDLGAWTARLEADVGAEQLGAFRAGTLVPPGAEGWPAFLVRIGEAVEALGRRGGTWLVVTHGGCVRAAVAHVTGASIEAFAGPSNTSLTVVELAPRRRLLVLNRTSGEILPRPSEPGGA